MANNDDANPYGMKRPNKEDIYKFRKKDSSPYGPDKKDPNKDKYSEKKRPEPKRSAPNEDDTRKVARKASPPPYGPQKKDPNKGKDFNTKEPEPKQYGPKTKEPDLNELRRVHSESNSKSNVPPTRKKVEISTTPKKDDLKDRPSVKNPVPGTNLQRKHGEKTPAGAKVADRMRKAQADKKALNKAWGNKGK